MRLTDGGAYPNVKVERAQRVDALAIDGPRARIRVRQGDECVLLAPWVPAVSSAYSAWNGALIEEHKHGPYHAGRHQHLSHFLCMHLSDPAPLAWKSQGKGGSEVVCPGQFVLLSRGTEDEFSFATPVRRILLNLEPWLIDQACPSTGSGREIELVNHWVVHDPQVEHIVRALKSDLESGLPSGRLFGETLISALAIHLRKKYAVVPLRTPGTPRGLPRARLKQVLEYVDANLEQEISLAGLASTAGMSPNYFAESFKRSVGVAPHQYVIRKRIDRARHLLQDTRMTVLEAGVRSGFSDHSHFTKVFRRILGITPTQYRAQM